MEVERFGVSNQEIEQFFEIFLQILLEFFQLIKKEFLEEIKGKEILYIGGHS